MQSARVSQSTWEVDLLFRSCRWRHIYHTKHGMKTTLRRDSQRRWHEELSMTSHPNLVRFLRLIGPIFKVSNFPALYLRLTGSVFVPVKNVVFLMLRTFTRLSILNHWSFPLSGTTLVVLSDILCGLNWSVPIVLTNCFGTFLNVYILLVVVSVYYLCILWSERNTCAKLMWYLRLHLHK